MIRRWLVRWLRSTTSTFAEEKTALEAISSIFNTGQRSGEKGIVLNKAIVGVAFVESISQPGALRKQTTLARSIHTLEDKDKAKRAFCW